MWRWWCPDDYVGDPAVATERLIQDLRTDRGDLVTTMRTQEPSEQVGRSREGPHQSKEGKYSQIYVDVAMKTIASIPRAAQTGPVAPVASVTTAQPIPPNTAIR